MARRHAGSALVDHAGRRRRSERGFELLPQRLRRLERLVRFEVALPGTVARPRDVSRDRIDRFLLAAIALRRARVEHEPFVRAEVAHDVVGPDQRHRGRAIGELSWRRRGGPGARQARLRDPSRPPAVEDRDARVAEPARQPPQPHREVAAVGVVRDDLRVVVHAPSPERPHDIGAVREGDGGRCGRSSFPTGRHRCGRTRRPGCAPPCRRAGRLRRPSGRGARRSRATRDPRGGPATARP